MRLSLVTGLSPRLFQANLNSREEAGCLVSLLGHGERHARAIVSKNYNRCQPEVLFVRPSTRFAIAQAVLTRIPC